MNTNPINMLCEESPAEKAARMSPTCPACGTPKAAGPNGSVVCWKCFKEGPNCLKYFNGSYDEWMEWRARTAWMGEEETVSKIAVANAMQKYGGGFVKALSECIIRADPDNLRRLQTAFPEYWEQYLEFDRKDAAAAAATARAFTSDGGAK